MFFKKKNRRINCEKKDINHKAAAASEENDWHSLEWSSSSIISYMYLDYTELASTHVNQTFNNWN